LQLQVAPSKQIGFKMLTAYERGTRKTTTTKIDQNHTDTILGGQSPQSVD